MSIPLTHTELTNISAVNQKIIHRADLDLEYMTVLLSELPIYCQQKKIVKLREREGQRVDLGRSLKGHLWMVDGGWWISFP